MIFFHPGHTVHPPLASGRGGEAYFVIVTNFASGGGDVAYIVTNPALPLASLSLWVKGDQ